MPPAYVEKWLDVLDRLHNHPAELKRRRAAVRAQEADGRYNASRLAAKFAAFVAA